MAKAQVTTSVRAKPASALPHVLQKERRLRRWAARVVSDLPPDAEEAARVLTLASELRRSWLGGVQ